MVVTCPHCGSDCMGLSPSFAAYELCDFGKVISLCLSFVCTNGMVKVSTPYRGCDNYELIYVKILG